MGRYSFMGSYSNLSENEVNFLHKNVNRGRCLVSTNMLKNMQSLRDKRYNRQKSLGNITLRPGNMHGYWFK